jgi:hypothetical protein
MKLRTLFIATAVAAASWALPVTAAPSFKDAKPSDLGKTLTQFGAIKAGNEEGTIPAYTGGIKTTDKAYNEKPYPFASEKPRFVITAQNMAKYADKLDPGTKALLKRYPKYHLNVYPTHRTVSYPDSVLKKTVANASNPECKLVANGNGVDQACRLGLPFPLPKNGNELLWNHQLTYKGISHKGYIRSYYEARDHTVMTVASNVIFNNGYYAKDNPKPKVFLEYWGKVDGPPRNQGILQLQRFFLSPDDNGGKLKKTWLYTPGLRRVTLTPNASHDTPSVGSGGNATYGEQKLFSGMPNRFDWKLVGRKEMFIPYNNFKATFGCKDKEMMTPNSPNADCIRWELHRVWVIKGTLKPNKHSIYSKRVYYFDEDSYMGGLYNAYDHAGNLFRTALMMSIPLPKFNVMLAHADIYWNLTKTGYYYENYAESKQGQITYHEYEDSLRDKLYPPSIVSPGALEQTGFF